VSAPANTFTEPRIALRSACAQVGIDPIGAEPIRMGENAIYRLPTRVIVRVARSGQAQSAAKEVAVARWLATEGIEAIEAIDIEQPVVVENRAVTFWHELPDHRQGTLTEIASLLKRLHACTPPTTFKLPALAPFVRLAKRIDGASTLTPDDRDWLHRRLVHLQEAYRDLPHGLPLSVIHGDAWAGNVAATLDGRVVLLDLERCALGLPEWDLISTAVRYSSFGTIDGDQYGEFARVYGYDVLTWSGFEVLRDIRELRVTCYAAQRAVEDPSARAEAARRVASLRGRNGERPWTDWNALD
jgi:Ser/Thr protein kinase RdoA (MazF antagonist)